MQARQDEEKGWAASDDSYHLWAPLLLGNIFATLEIIDDTELWSTDGTILSSEPLTSSLWEQSLKEKMGEEGLSTLPPAVLRLLCRSRGNSEWQNSSHLLSRYCFGQKESSALQMTAGVRMQPENAGKQTAN